MLYKALYSCTDFDGRFYAEGEVAELPEGRHSAFLVPVEQAESAAAETETTSETTKKTTRKTTRKTKAKESEENAVGGGSV